MPVCLLRAAVIAALFALPQHAMAQDTALPDYVIDAYGTPPDTPEGPLPQALQDAVRVVFVDSLANSDWGRDQQIALGEIAASGDPRLAWAIADMMRFTWRASFDDALAEAAAQLLEIRYDSPRRWGRSPIT